MATLKTGEGVTDKGRKHIDLEKRFLLDIIGKIKNSIDINVNSPHNIGYVSSSRYRPLKTKAECWLC